VKVAVIQNDGAWRVGLSQSELLAENQFESGIANEVALHLDAAVDRRVDHISRGVEKDVNFLVNVDKDLIGVVFADRD